MAAGVAVIPHQKKYEYECSGGGGGGGSMADVAGKDEYMVGFKWQY